jgi:hypothetical protein
VFAKSEGIVKYMLKTPYVSSNPPPCPYSETSAEQVKEKRTKP